MFNDTIVIETIARPAPPDKRALDYLMASGAAAISIVVDIDGAMISLGLKPDAVAVFWLPQPKARSVAAKARAITGDGMTGVEVALAALHEAAVFHAAHLTEHSVAISRAGSAAERLEEFMTSMQGTGTLREFSKTYRRRRIAAAERGEGFMSYQTAVRRLRLALVPILMNGGKPSAGSLFAEVFNV
jgi:hypothetical protein